jgi:hypothetical protein
MGILEQKRSRAAGSQQEYVEVECRAGFSLQWGLTGNNLGSNKASAAPANLLYHHLLVAAMRL